LLEVPSDSYDVTVAYRVYPKVSRIPAIFADDKLKLAELCLRSFRESLGSLRVKVLVLLDGCPPEYAELFRKYFAPGDLELIPLDGVGNRMTFALQTKLLLEQSYSELVYFSEDDYFYFPDQLPSMVRLMRAQSDVDFATPYDHLDYYNRALHRYPTRKIAFEGREWRTVASTCLTFLTSKSVLRETQRVFDSYGRTRGNTDGGLWFSLTKFEIRNPLNLLRVGPEKTLFLSVAAMSWYFGWRQLLFGTKWNLWAPVPTIATHLDHRYLPPGYDWPAILAGAATSIR
jgi:hypothetical protein